jgi:hypothetical protein
MPTPASAKIFQAAQNTAGTPVTVKYQLATPIITQHHLGPLASFPRYTHVEQVGAGVAVCMELGANVVDK